MQKQAISCGLALAQLKWAPLAAKLGYKFIKETKNTVKFEQAGEYWTGVAIALAQDGAGHPVQLVLDASENLPEIGAVVACARVVSVAEDQAIQNAEKANPPKSILPSNKLPDNTGPLNTKLPGETGPQGNATPMTSSRQ
ncbi:hypothetical protein [Streptomyces sp. NPDC127190]|uniref:hypothetical protein n=1 Tax=unclassified Streptomyces TaxID=2593676 RepID=UPI00362D2B68